MDYRVYRLIQDLFESSNARLISGKIFIAADNINIGTKRFEDRRGGGNRKGKVDRRIRRLRNNPTNEHVIYLFLLYLEKFFGLMEKNSLGKRDPRKRKEIFSPRRGIVVFSNAFEPVASVRFIYTGADLLLGPRRRIYIKRYPCFTVSLFLQASSRRIMPAGGHLVAQITPAKRAGTGGFITSVSIRAPPTFSSPPEFSRLVSIVAPSRSRLRFFHFSTCLFLLYSRVLRNIIVRSLFDFSFLLFTSER